MYLIIIVLPLFDVLGESLFTVCRRFKQAIPILLHVDA